MESKKKLLEILKNEYGITTMAQLDNALTKQKTIDLSPFVDYDGLGIKTKGKKA